MITAPAVLCFVLEKRGEAKCEVKTPKPRGLFKGKRLKAAQSGLVGGPMLFLVNANPDTRIKLEAAGFGQRQRPLT
jgi:hypothetical protein